eukprot:PhF_6_TR7329/c0_g1_i1/m.11005
MRISDSLSSVQQSSIRRCGLGSALKYDGSQFEVINVTIEGGSVSTPAISNVTQPLCLDVHITPNGTQRLQRLRLIGCGQDVGKIDENNRNQSSKETLSVGTAVQVSVHASLLAMESETMIATLSMRQLVSFTCVDALGGGSSDPQQLLLYPHSLIVASDPEDQPRIDILSCVVILLVVYGCHG